MNKFSRMHGLMWLRTSASGDGSISFSWARNVARSGASLPELVTESDVSEFLRLSENGERWKGWDILDLGYHAPSIRLVQNVERPFHSIHKLEMRGVRYRYEVDLKASKGSALQYDNRTTAFYEDGSTLPIENLDIVQSLCFFLNNEDAFCRRMAQRMA